MKMRLTFLILASLPAFLSDPHRSQKSTAARVEHRPTAAQLIIDIWHAEVKSTTSIQSYTGLLKNRQGQGAI